MRMSLAPTFTPCPSGSANATHQTPLAAASCNPPAPSSSLVAVGPESLGFTRLIVLGPGQCAPFDATRCYPDVTIRVGVTDVHSGSPTGPDYDTSNPSGQDLTLAATLPGQQAGNGLQATDLYNQAAGQAGFNDPATVTPLSFPVPVGCSPVAGAAGSVCGATTTANALVPGSAVAGKRAIWELGEIQLYDQGGNGVPGDADDHVFEAQGVFAP
jgi:hypothetical protein